MAFDVYRRRGNSWFGGLSILGMSLIFASCGSDRIDVTVNLKYENDVVRNFVLSGHQETALRFLYTNAEITTANLDAVVQPRSAAPPAVQVNQQSLFYDFAKAMSGYPFTSGSSITLRNLPLKKRSTKFAIEFLHKIAGEWYAVAYGVYPPVGSTDPTLEEALSGAQLKVDLAAIPLTIYLGRTCGKLSSPKTLSSASSPADSVFTSDTSPLSCTSS